MIGIAPEESAVDFETLQQSFVVEQAEGEMTEGEQKPAPKKAAKLVKRNKVGVSWPITLRKRRTW